MQYCTSVCLLNFSLWSQWSRNFKLYSVEMKCVLTSCCIIWSILFCQVGNSYRNQEIHCIADMNMFKKRLKTVYVWYVGTLHISHWLMGVLYEVTVCIVDMYQYCKSANCCSLVISKLNIGCAWCTGYTFCELHRLPEQHTCTYNHKENGRQEAREKMVSPKKHVGTSLRRLDS